MLNSLMDYIKTPEGFLTLIAIIIGLFLGKKYIIKKQKGGHDSLNFQAESINITGDVVHRDKVVYIESSPNIASSTSNVEKTILKYLHSKYDGNVASRRDTIRNILTKTGLPSDCDFSTVNDSKYLKVEGSDIFITPEGLRYMDNLPISEKNKLVSSKD